MNSHTKFYIHQKKKKLVETELIGNLVKSKDEAACNFILECSNFGKGELFRNIHIGLHEVRSTDHLTCNKYWSHFLPVKNPRSLIGYLSVDIFHGRVRMSQWGLIHTDLCYTVHLPVMLSVPSYQSKRNNIRPDPFCVFIPSLTWHESQIRGISANFHESMDFVEIISPKWKSFGSDHFNENSIIGL